MTFTVTAIFFFNGVIQICFLQFSVVEYSFDMNFAFFVLQSALFIISWSIQHLFSVCVCAWLRSFQKCCLLSVICSIKLLIKASKLICSFFQVCCFCEAYCNYEVFVLCCVRFSLLLVRSVFLWPLCFNVIILTQFHAIAFNFNLRTAIYCIWCLWLVPLFCVSDLMSRVSDLVPCVSDLVFV